MWVCLLVEWAEVPRNVGVRGGSGLPFRIQGRRGGLAPSASPLPPSLPHTMPGIMPRGGAAQVAVWPAAHIKVL